MPFHPYDNRILSNAGASVADIYDVKGSQAPLEYLDSQDVKTVHEMGGTIFAERLGGSIIQASVTGVLQSANWDINMLKPVFPPGVSRILNISIIASDAARVSAAQISFYKTTGFREMPLFTWDSAVDTEVPMRWTWNGSAGDFFHLRPSGGTLGVPTMLIGSGQQDRVEEMRVRGRTLAFGAGTVSLYVTIYFAYCTLTGPGSRGLPIPAW